MAGSSGHDIEIWYGLGGGEPFLIGGGSFEAAGEVFTEAEQLAPDQTRPGHEMSPRTEHFYRRMARNAGVTPQYEAAMSHYDSQITAARQAFRDSLAGDDTAK
jgi:hypothetical protein